MEEMRMEAALHALSRQIPHAPAILVDGMAGSTGLPVRERAMHKGRTAEPVRGQKTLSTGNPEKDIKKTLWSIRENRRNMF